jgi:hypothetical protein
MHEEEKGWEFVKNIESFVHSLVNTISSYKPATKCKDCIFNLVKTFKIIPGEVKAKLLIL